MLKSFKRKLKIQKRAEEKKQNKYKNDDAYNSIDEYMDSKIYENRNIIYDVIGFLFILFSGILGMCRCVNCQRIHPTPRHLQDSIF